MGKRKKGENNDHNNDKIRIYVIWSQIVLLGALNIFLNNFIVWLRLWLASAF